MSIVTNTTYHNLADIPYPEMFEDIKYKDATFDIEELPHSDYNFFVPNGHQRFTSASKVNKTHFFEQSNFIAEVDLVSSTAYIHAKNPDGALRLAGNEFNSFRYFHNSPRFQLTVINFPEPGVYKIECFVNYTFTDYSTVQAYAGSIPAADTVLTSLTSGFDLTPAFGSNIRDYTVVIPSTADSVSVNYTKANPESKVTLQPGLSLIQLCVVEGVVEKSGLTGLSSGTTSFVFSHITITCGSG